MLSTSIHDSSYRIALFKLFKLELIYVLVQNFITWFSLCFYYSKKNETLSMNNLQSEFKGFIVSCVKALLFVDFHGIFITKK